MEQFAVKPVITFGTGALAALEELPGERVLVITDGFLAKSGLLDKVLAHLKGRTVEIFDQVVPDPPIDLVAKGARALADFKPRTVVAFGGDGRVIALFNHFTQDWMARKAGLLPSA